MKLNLSPEMQHKYDHYRVLLLINSNAKNIIDYGIYISQNQKLKCLLCMYYDGTRSVINQITIIEDKDCILWYFYDGKEINEETYIRLLKLKAFL
jgi:hypothetical protein